MSDQTHQRPKESSAEQIIEAIANWITNYRNAVPLHTELAHCGAEEVARVAHDLRMGPEEFSAVMAVAQDQLALRLMAVDPQLSRNAAPTLATS